MQRRPITVAALVGATLALAATGASATTMHTEFGAHLSGMGEHGTVNLHVTSGKLCWAFEVPTVKHPTRADIRTGASGPVLLELGMDYTKSGCAKESMMTLEHLEAKPGAYSVWVDTKAHAGEVRGTLLSGMVSM